MLPTGSALITNYVTSSYSASLVPTIDDYNKLIYNILSNKSIISLFLSQLSDSGFLRYYRSLKYNEK